MAWIELHQTLPTNKRTLRLKKILKIKTPQAIGHLCLLWLWALDNAEDGDLSVFSADEISEVVEWTGKEPEAFVSALIEAGFVDADMRIHNWEKYAGKLMDNRDIKREQDRIRQKRRRDKSAELRDSHADVTRDTCVNHAPIPYPTVPYPTVPYQTVPKDTDNNNDNHAREGEGKGQENPELGKVMSLYMDRICANPSRGSIDELIAYTQNLSGPVVVHAIEIACDDNKRSWSYIRAILRDYQSAKVKSLDDVQAREAQRQETRNKTKQAGAETNNPFLKMLIEDGDIS